MPRKHARLYHRALLLSHGLELVADAVACLDEGVPRGAVVDLLSQPADEHVHRAVAVVMAPAPRARPEILGYLGAAERVIRPANVASGSPGRAIAVGRPPTGHRWP